MKLNLLVIAVFGVSCAFAEASVRTVKPGEPLAVDFYTPDPAPVADGDTLWVFTGRDLPGSYFNMPGWQVLSTQDMKTWTNHGMVMDTSVFKWAKQGNDAWASQAIKRGGKWFWYVAVGDAAKGIHGIGVATADSPLGPWTDPIGKPLLPGNWGYIDPSVFIDDDGQAWLFWGNNNCWYAPLKANMVELDGPIKQVPGLMDEKAFGPHKMRDGKPATNFEEAPWIYKRGDTYYLEYAAGGVPEHWAYSTAKSVHGPWTYRGKILGLSDRSFTIHGGSVAFKGKNYMFYHNGMAPKGGGFQRSAAFLPFEYKADGSIPYIPFHGVEVTAYEHPDKNGGLGLRIRKDGGPWEDAVGHNHCFTKSNLGNWPEKNLYDPVLYRTEDGRWHVFYKDRKDEKAKDCHAVSWNPWNLRDWGRQRWVDTGEERALLKKARAAGGVWEIPGEYADDIFKSEWHEGGPWHFTLDQAKEDEQRYGAAVREAKPKLRLTFDAKPAYPISQNLMGIFFEDINSSYEVYSTNHVGTFKGHGFRKDIGEALLAMKPKFVRFPGGCIVHGHDFNSMYRWKDTVGPLKDRKGRPNPCWGTYMDFALGYYEYFQLCEDLGADPVPILSAGVSCPNPQRAVSDAELKILVEDAVDLIDFAKGDPRKSKWAKLRADMGHPKPFKLNYIGVGNEEDVNDYFERGFKPIVAAIRAKDPFIKIVGTAGAFCAGRDYEEGWRVSKREKIEIVDEHYYVGPGWYYGNQFFYDDYDRNGPKVYAGEYAAHKKGRVNDMETALSLAVHLTNLERNGDIVEMASYAPLFAKKGAIRWSPDLIYFTDDDVELTTDYWVQWAFGNFTGEKYVPNTLEVVLSNGKVGVKAKDERRTPELGKLNRGDSQRFFNRFSSSVVTRGKKTIMKLVNSTAFPMDVEADLTKLGVTAPAQAGVWVLTGAFDDQKAQPTKGRERLDPQLKRTLPAYSLTVLVF